MDYIFSSIGIFLSYFHRNKPWRILSDTQRINKSFSHAPDATHLKIVFSGWGDGVPFVTRLLLRKLNKKGFATLAYGFPREILAGQAKEVPSIFSFIQKTVQEDIDQLTDVYHFETIEVIGFSLGAVLASMVANGNEKINTVSLIVPGSSLAGSLWDGIRTQGLRKKYEKEGYTKTSLENLWQSLAPEENISHFEKKHVFIALSRADKVIPFMYGKNLIEVLSGKYSLLYVEENNNLGHYLTIGKYHFLSGKLM